MPKTINTNGDTVNVTGAVKMEPGNIYLLPSGKLIFYHNENLEGLSSEERKARLKKIPQEMGRNLIFY